MQLWQMVDRMAARATALCLLIISASHVLGEALSLQCSSCSRRWRALEQRNGPNKRPARVREGCGFMGDEQAAWCARL